MSMRTLFSISLGAVLVFWAVGAYNRLVRLKNTIGNAFGQIDVQLKRRYDLIPNLVDAAKKYLRHEQSALEAVIAARNQARGASDAVRSRPSNAAAVTALAVAEQALSGSLANLFAVADYNNAQGQFPALLIARLFGFAPSAMLRAIGSPLERQAVHIQQ
ncbi:MAG: LemA family protein [Polaromonas sp.]